MRTWRVMPGGKIDGLALAEEPAPKPGAGQVRVRLAAASLNFRDLMILRGGYPTSAPGPLVPCSDGAGTVLETGAGVTRFKPGDRVATSFFPDWVDGAMSLPGIMGALGGGGVGTLAEEIVLGEQALVPCPVHLSDAEAATLTCAGTTAWHALFEATHLQPGSTVLLLGTGGVSIWALQLAKAAGARVIITSSSDAKLERARALGADEVIDHATEDIAARVREITKRKGVEIVVEHVGGRVFEAGVASLAKNGRLVTCGATIGHKVSLDVNALFGRHLAILGSWMGTRNEMLAVIAQLSGGRLEPVVDQVMPLAEARAAHERIESRAHFGKIVLVP
jgi:2-desacetyl-2-hydroxyethyl bacteriochlorophyllide A dehydrogenase